MSFGLGADGISAEVKPMTDEQMKRFLSSEIQNAMFYLDSSENISSSRYRNWQYYRGVMDDLPHLKGQSSVKSSEVHDYISMMLPSLLRPFTSGDKLFDYQTPQGQDPEMAKTISRYINQIVFKKDNRGEIILNDWAWDGLVQKNGVVKVWWHEDKDFKDEDYQGLTDAEYALKSASLDADEEITAYNRTPNLVPDGQGGQTQQGNIHDLQIRKTINTSRCKIACIPIDEFVISRDARDYEDAILKCHRSWEVAGELIEQGYDPAIVNRLPTFAETRSELTRPGSTGREQNRQNIGDPSLRKVTVYEGIVKCNYDGTGVRHWYFKAGGQDGGVELLDIEPHKAQVFFAPWTPEPIPHQFVGTCPADRLSEIQKVNTVLIRQFLQNIYLTNAPQREVVADNILSPDQLSNFAPGASIMVKSVGSVNAIPLPFSAAPALELIQYFDGKAADRSGVSRTSAGLDPDALQNQSATAANLAWNASMGRLEMVAKIWAYTGMRMLGDAILKVIIAYQDFPRAVVLEGETVTVDPRQWSAFSDMDVNVSTGLGTGHRDRDMAFMNNVLNMQQQWLQKFGPTPVVDFSKVVATCQKIAEIGGISSPEAYFGTVQAGWIPPPPPPPGPTPDAQLKAKTEMARIQVDAQAKSATNQTQNVDIQTKAALENQEQTLEWMLGLIQARLDQQKAHNDLHKRPNGKEMPTAFPGTGR